jgi:hypothetical protein
MRQNFVAGSLGSSCIAKKCNVTGFNEVQHGGKVAECVERTENTCSFLGQGQGLTTILKDAFLSRALQVLQRLITLHREPNGVTSLVLIVDYDH